MRCFYHEDREAVGACRSCSKGLCKECAIDFGKGLACRGRCEQDVQAVIQLVDRSVRLSATSTQLIKSNRGSRFVIGLFHVILGIIFIWWGMKDSERFNLITILGFGFVGYGAYWTTLAARLPKNTPGA